MADSEVIEIDEGDDIAKEVGEKWCSWKMAKSSYEGLVQEIQEYLFATDTEGTSNSTNPHSHKTHRPKLAQIRENLIANYAAWLFPNDGWVKLEAVGKTGLEKEKRELVEEYIKSRHRLSGFKNRVKQVLTDWVDTGNGYTETRWVNNVANESLGTTGYRGPKTFRIDPDDIAYNVLSRSFEDAPKIIRRVTTVGDIAADIQAGNLSESYNEVLRRSLQWRTDAATGAGEQWDEYRQLWMDGLGTVGDYVTGDTVEILEFYGNHYNPTTGELYVNQHITVMDRRFLIESKSIDTWTGKPHIFKSGWKDRRKCLVSQGPLDSIVGMQYMVNHLENQRADAFDDMILYDIVTRGDVQTKYDERGRKVYQVRDEYGDVTKLNPDSIVLQADMKIQELEAKMEEYVGAPREASGIRTPGEKTKFEVMSLSTAASRMFQNKVEKFEQDILIKILAAELELAVRNESGAQVPVKVLGEEVIAEVSKEDLVVEGSLVPQGASFYSKLQKMAQELSRFQTVLQTDPEVAIHFPAEKIARVWDAILSIGEGGSTLFKRFGRIPERVESQRLQKAGQTVLAEEDAADIPNDQGSNQ